MNFTRLLALVGDPRLRPAPRWTPPTSVVSSPAGRKPAAWSSCDAGYTPLRPPTRRSHLTPSWSLLPAPYVSLQSALDW